MNSIGSNEQVVATGEEVWGVATMTFSLGFCFGVRVGIYLAIK